MNRLAAMFVVPGLLLIPTSRTCAQSDAEVKHLVAPGGVEFGLVGGKPAAPSPVVFMIALDIDRTLTDPNYNRVGTLLAKEGFRYVALDPPCHGKDNAENVADALAGWRTRIERGVDVPAGFAARCTAVLDHLIRQGYVDPKRVAVAGTSRGGFLALHWAAVEPRVRCVAAFAPVTELPALAEFRGTENDARVTNLAAAKLVDRLIDRPIWLCIGNDDQRVGTDNAIAFTRTLVAAAKAKHEPPRVELHVTAAPGHSVHPTAHAEARRGSRRGSRPG